MAILRSEALPAFTKLGDVGAIAVTQTRSPTFCFGAGIWRVPWAATCPVGAIRELGDVHGIAASLWGIAQIELAQEKTEDAFSQLMEAWPLPLQLGRADGIAVVGQLLGQMLVTVDLKEEGLSVLRKNAEAYRILGREPDAQSVDDIIARLFA